ncbi:MAG: metallophosphoesterase [Bacillota bacterium]
MSTTDIHAHVMHYDYMKDSVDEGIGLAKVATLVQQVRGKYPNTILVDAGDVIQGSILGDLEALVKPIQKGDLHAVIGSMNMMGYDAVCVGNHEFNYGLDFLKRAYEGAQFPLVNANVYQAGTEDNYFTPYVILEREVDGNSIKIGIIGFVPPQIMIWDKIRIEGRVYTKGIVETAKKFIPEMKAEGAT